MASVACLLLLAVSCFETVSASPAKSTNKAKRQSTIPDYAITYAPYSYIYSGENYWCSDIATHLEHVTPEVNFTAVESSVTLETLDELPSDVYLTSDDDPLTAPAWLTSVANIPDSTGYTPAPATIIVADKGAWVDVFYFYFYSYNQGLEVLFEVYGNHVGDWEHSMIRFVDGVPQYIYLSEHSSGSAYNFTTLPQIDGRPATYIANGSHANYATTGHQDYEGTALGLIGLYDTTDAGVYWDVTQNYRGFFFDNSTQTFTSAGGVGIGGSEQGAEGVDWLYWLGAWGDEQYPNSDPEQNCDLEVITGDCKFVSGPTGPYDKNLGRTAVCENESNCPILAKPSDLGSQ